MESIAEGLQLFQRGGIVMYALLACSLFVVYVGVERWLFYQRMDAGKAFAQQFYTYMKLKKYDEACEAARRGQGGLALILSDAFACDDERRALVLFERHRHHGSLAGASRDDQRHDYVVQHFQRRIGPIYRHYGRRRRGSRGDGLWAVRSHSGSGSSRLFYAAPGPHHYGHGTVFFCS